MNKIFKAKDLPDGEEVYLKKSFDGWRVVHPWKKDLDKPVVEDKGEEAVPKIHLDNIHCKNFFCGGSYWNLVKVIILVLFILGSVWAYYQDVIVVTDAINNIMEDPYQWCAELPTRTNPMQHQDLNFTLNWGEINGG